jgi:hypothetical protein
VLLLLDESEIYDENQPAKTLKQNEPMISATTRLLFCLIGISGVGGGCVFQVTRMEGA